MAYDKGMKQHQNMARGNGIADADETFGCAPHDATKGPMMASVEEMEDGHVKDGDRRGAGKPVRHSPDKHPAQAQPDHGKHAGADGFKPVAKPSGRYGEMP